jgi:FecR protein
MSRRKLGIAVSVLTALVCGLLTLPALASSQARIVRLSDVEGAVEVDRSTGQGYEKAFLNMPITEGAKLWTKSDGRAEVEFEDGSVVRIVPDTKISFSQLSLADSGKKLSTVKVDEGTAYINFRSKKDSELTVRFGHESAKLTEPAHLRVNMQDTDATLAVFTGEVEVAGPSGSVKVGKKQSATFDLAASDHYELAKNVEPDPYDKWDKEQAQYHDHYYASNSYNGYPYSYGVSDLNYYGGFYNVPGYGYLWQPYFAGVGWSPFTNGAWCWYPGFGYTWVSAYPWGWMPYRYGTWVFVPAYGWAWQPGGWSAWNTVPAAVNPPNRFAPPQAPATGGHPTVIVGSGGTGSGAGSRRVMITQGTAGLGIPRGRVRNLPVLSDRVASRGSAMVHAAPSSVAPRFNAPRTMGSPGRMGPSAPRMSAPSHSAPSHVSAPSSRH